MHCDFFSPFKKKAKARFYNSKDSGHQESKFFYFIREKKKTGYGVSSFLMVGGR
jgi:hypothetical protein